MGTVSGRCLAMSGCWKPTVRIPALFKLRLHEFNELHADHTAGATWRVGYLRLVSEFAR